MLSGLLLVVTAVVAKFAHADWGADPQPCNKTVIAHNVSDLEAAVNDRSVCDIQLLTGSYMLADGLKVDRALSIRGNATAIDGSLMPAFMRCNCLLTVLAGASVVLDHLVFMRKPSCSSATTIGYGSTLCNIGTLTLVDSTVINNGGDLTNVSPKHIKTLDHALNCNFPMPTHICDSHPSLCLTVWRWHLEL